MKTEETDIEKRREALTKLLSEETDSLKICQKCKMCLSVCPVYEGWYTEGPVGRITAIYYHFNYGVGTKKELADLLYSCATCRKCQTLCKQMAMGVETTDLIVQARHILVEMQDLGETENEKK
jgi:Fe-S oxidoreductase